MEEENQREASIAKQIVLEKDSITITGKDEKAKFEIPSSLVAKLEWIRKSDFPIPLHVFEWCLPYVDLSLEKQNGHFSKLTIFGNTMESGIELTFDSENQRWTFTWNSRNQDNSFCCHPSQHQVEEIIKSRRDISTYINNRIVGTKYGKLSIWH